MTPSAVPVVMYHGVGPDRPDWLWNYLITPVEVFEGQMRVLAEEGWTTITLADLHSHMSKGTPLPDKPVVLTFDDGYRDNWVYAFPILKKYGHHAVIWMSTDFVDPCPKVSPTLDDVWAGRLGEGDLIDKGYLSWKEMRRMVSSGCVEIQSHAKTHTWYFSGPTIIDFHRPSGLDGYVTRPWLAWNRFPERKHDSMTADIEKDVPYGTPIYEYGKSLITRRYFEDADLTRLIVEKVAADGGRAFFKSKGWREELLAVVNGYPSRKDRIETDEEYEQRVREELSGSRTAIEDALGTKVEFLCWPGGGHTPFTRKIASEVGYLATTTHYGDSARRNIFGQNSSEINRIGGMSPWVWRGRAMIRHTDPEFLTTALASFAGDKKSLWRLRCYKLRYLIRYYLRGYS